MYQIVMYIPWGGIGTLFVVGVQLLRLVQLFATPWTAARQAFLSFTISRSLFKLMSIESVMPFNHLVFCRPLSLLQPFPASESFSISWLFVSGGQSIEASASASVLPMKIQGWFPLGLTGLISFSYGAVQSLSGVWLFVTPWTAAARFLYPSPTTGACSNSCP